MAHLLQGCHLTIAVDIEVMVGVDGFLEYLAELTWNVANSSSEYLREHPMFLAHSIGALKIISGISISEVFHDDLLSSGILGAVLSLLYFVNGTALNKINQAAEQIFSPQASAKLLQDTEFSEEQPLKATHPNIAVSPESKSQPLEEVSFDERKNTASPVTHSESSSTPEDFEDAFSTFVRLAIITVYNCKSLFTGADECRESLFKSGTLHTLWCTLLTSNDSTLSLIGLPVETLLNNISCMVSSEKDVLESVVELDERFKTPALVLGADNLEVCNFNWTFESVRATMCVGRSRYLSSPHPLGWYYEVILKSNGILQIGWQTEECRYGPEKGVGVGDDHSSCAFDGARCKVWSGPPSEHQNNDYGKEWQYGDVLSCLFSWDGEVSFWINGIDQGVAFSSMNSYTSWYPAASLAMDQHCVFNFGNKPFKYELPEGYVAVSHIVKKKPTVRMSSCWTPLKESVESMVEEDRYPGEDLPSKGSRMSDLDSSQSQLKDAEALHSSFEPPSLVPEEKTRIQEQEERPNQPTTSLVEEVPETLLATRSESENESNQADWKVSVSTHAVGKKKRMSFKLQAPVTPTSQMPHEEDATNPTVSPWLQFSPSETLTADNETASFPCLYFEADLSNAPSKARQIGFFDPNTGDKIYCDLYGGQLYLPRTAVHSPSSQECYKCPEVVGCGIMWPAGVVIFTLDGVGTGKSYPFPSDRHLDIQNILPYISCSRIRCNYGQTRFLCEGVNFKEVCYAGANLLHAHGLSDQIKTRNIQQM